MEKGVSPIIVSVLFIVLVIALAGSFLAWGNSLKKDIDDTTERVADNVEKLENRIAIFDIKDDIITIKNTGENEILVEDISLIVDNVLIEEPNPQAGVVSIKSGDMIEFDVNIFSECSDVKALGPGTSDLYSKEEYFFNQSSC